MSKLGQGPIRSSPKYDLSPCLDFDNGAWWTTPCPYYWWGGRSVQSAMWWSASSDSRADGQFDFSVSPSPIELGWIRLGLGLEGFGNRVTNVKPPLAPPPLV